jgi:hypothetical protein
VGWVDYWWLGFTSRSVVRPQIMGSASCTLL